MRIMNELEEADKASDDVVPSLRHVLLLLLCHW